MTQPALPVKWGVAALNNVVLASILMERLINAPFNHPKIGVLYGHAGLGKSSAAIYLMNQHNAIRIECKSVWNRKTVFEEILNCMGIIPGKTLPIMLNQICAELQNSGRPLIIDEMDYLVDKGTVEIIRDIHEGAGQHPILLIGEERLYDKLMRWERFHSRILEKTRVEPLDVNDARLLSDFYCRKITISEDMLEYIHEQSGGSARRICVNLSFIEEKALSNGISAIDRDIWGNEPLYTAKPQTRGVRK